MLIGAVHWGNEGPRAPMHAVPLAYVWVTSASGSSLRGSECVRLVVVIVGAAALMCVSCSQGYGWLSPTVGALEFMQCMTQALTTSTRKNLVQTQKVISACKRAAPAAQASAFLGVSAAGLSLEIHR